MANPFQIAFDVWADLREPLARHLSPKDIEAINDDITERSRAASPRIMVFGTYNAGKSTLINALLGEEKARVADHPETDQVTSYPWRGFILDDTPGIDAPIEHERVTLLHLEKSDAVLFVLATDGTLEERQSFDKIVEIVRSGKPIRVILNNKSGLRVDSPDLLELRRRLVDNLRLVATEAGIDDIETLVPIRVVNAASGLRGRREGKQALLASSFLPELEADIFELCHATGKARMAKTVCSRMVKQIDLVLNGMKTDDGSQPITEATVAVATERTRLTAALAHVAQGAAAEFQSALGRALLSGRSDGGPAAAEKTFEDVRSATESELQRTQRVFHAIEVAFSRPTVISQHAGDPNLTLPEVSEAREIAQGARFQFSDAARLLAPAVQQIDRDVLVGGFMAAKQAFPAVFKGLGPAFAGRLVPLIGPAVQAVSSIYAAYEAHGEAQRAFEREKDRRVALAQQVVDAGYTMRRLLDRQCLNLIEAVFAPVEDALGEQAATLKGQHAIVAADQTTLIKCRGRLELATEE